MKMNFKNPNYQSNINGKEYPVDNNLLTFSTDKDVLQINYYGYKYGNQVIRIGHYETKTFNEIRWNLKDMLTFVTNPTFPYEVKGVVKEGPAPTLKIVENNNGYNVSVSTNSTTSFFLSKLQWKMFTERMVLGVKQYFYAKKYNSSLNQYDEKLLTECLPELMTEFKLDEKIKKFGKEKLVWKSSDEKLKLDINSVNIKKLSFWIDGKKMYLDFEYGLLIAQDIKSGKYFKFKTFKPGQKLFERLGGTTAQKAGREDKAPEARVFTIVTGSEEGTIVFKLEVGQGETTSTGGLQMVKVEQTYIATITKEESKKLSKAIDESIFSYLVYQYVEDSKAEDNKQKLQQIISFKTKNALLEAKSDALNMGKVRFNFGKYKEEGTKLKQDKFIDFYMEYDRMYELTEMLFSGELIKLVNAEKKRTEEETAKTGKKVWAKAVKVYSAGTGSKYGTNIKAKTFNIAPPISKTAAFNITAAQGAGKEIDKGLIRMIKPDFSIPMPLTADNMKMLVLMVNMYQKAFIVAQNIYLDKFEK